MFSKVNILLLAIFGAILGVQLFATWGDDDPRPTAGGVADFAATADATPTRDLPAPAASIEADRTASAPALVEDTSSFTSEPVGDVEQRREISSAAIEPSRADEAVALGVNADAGVGEFSAAPVAAAPVEATLSDGAAARGLPITYAETLSIRFHGYAEISGTFRVNDDETVSIPVIDRVSVAGMTGAELEAALAQRVFDITGRSSDVTVEVERYQPVFVSSGVARPGSFQWQRNMTVMHAIALSGGLYRSGDPQRTTVDLINAELDVEQALAELKRAIVRAARLRAERDGLAAIALPDRLVALAGEAEAARLIESEQSLLVVARTASSLELDAVEASLRAARDEIVRLEDLEVSVRAKIDERRAFIERMAGLEDRGYVTENRMADLRTSLIDLETNLAQVRVSIGQAEAARLRLERSRIELVQTRAAKLIEELVETEALIEARALAYEAARTLYAQLAGTPDAASVRASAHEITYTIVRRTEYGIETLTVDEFATLLPGDIVQISAPRPTAEEAQAPFIQFSGPIN